MNNKKAALLLSGCISLSTAGCLTAQADVGQYSSWEESYKNILLDFKTSEAYNAPGSDNDILCSMFDLKDITGDGIPELFISEGGYHPSMVEVYTFDDGDAFELLKAGSFGYIYYNNERTHNGVYFIESDMSQGVSTYTPYVYNNRGVTPEKTFIINESIADETIYLIDSKEVTKEAYDEAFSKYKDIKLLKNERTYNVGSVTEYTNLQSYYFPDRALLGDVNLDGILDGIDASAILTAYAKSSVEGGDTGLSDKQKSIADVNFDNIIDGIDATLVLTYYAKTSVGYLGSFEDFLAGKVFSGEQFSEGFESDSDAMQFLDGNWHILAGGQPISLKPPFTMFTDSDTSTFSIKQTDTSNAFSTGFRLLDLFATPRGCCNLIRTTPPGTLKTDGMTEHEIIDHSFDLNFTAAYVNGLPVIALKGIGNGISPLDRLMLGDFETPAFGWIFAKDINGDVTGIDDAKMAELRVKGKTFYAFRWLDMGSEVYLQEVTTMVTSTMYEDGNMRDAMYYVYKDNGHALTAVRYPIKGAEEYAYSGRYLPSLVKVTTDADGNVTNLTELQEMGHGYYYPG